MEFGNERGDAVGRDECSRLCPEIKPLGAVPEVEVEAVAICEVRLRDRGKMAGSPAADNPVSRSAGDFPAKAIGFRPVFKRQRAD